MFVCYVKAGQCGKEIVIRVEKITECKARVSFETSCENIIKLNGYLENINVGPEMTLPLIETEIYKKAAGVICRTSCVAPAAILKAIEVNFGLFPPVKTEINFLDIV